MLATRHSRKLLAGILILCAGPGIWDCAVYGQTNAKRDQQGFPAAQKVSAYGNEYDESNADPENLRRPALLLQRIARDQQQFWITPRTFRQPAAFKTFLSFAGFAALLIENDRSISNRFPANRIQSSRTLSNFGTLALAGGAAGSYALGTLTRNEHLRETGFLSGESAFNSSLITFLLQGATQRQRPLEGNGKGMFFKQGSSFPSQHAALAWSMASVVAHEYPGPLTKFLAYGLASTVSVTRVTGRQHFPSDVLVGSALGWYLGRQVYRAHHNPDLGGASWGNVDSDDSEKTEREPRPPARMGSTYVPLDSWIYPALDRLAALGYIETAFAGLKPWTRLECARLLDGTDDFDDQFDGAYRDLADLLSRLHREFAYELSLLSGGRQQNRTIALESAYVRGLSISGVPLIDGYHFGQTVADDFGRPFHRGMNAQAGGAIRAALGPAAFFVRAEFQHAPSAPAQSWEVRNFIAMRDDVPIPAATPFSSINRIRLLDAYLALNLRDGWQLSFGRQSLSWGPGPGASFLWSDNIEPIPMLRLTRSESNLPGLFRILGPARIESFFGKLEGHSYIPHPYCYGNKINFKPLPNLELGFGRTVTIGGKGGDPFTTGNFLLSLFGQTSSTLKSVPGDSNSSFDWTFYLPHLRNYVVFYGDLYADDDFVPFQNPAKNPFRPGIYLTRFPGLPKLDFHIEAAATDTSNAPKPANLNYWNYVYRDGYTSNGNLIGNTVGRMGRSVQWWSKYWISSRQMLQFSYKHSTVSKNFVPGGGAWQDYGLRHEAELQAGLYLKTQLQYEHISRFPILFGGSKGNFTAMAEVGFTPHSR